MESSSLRKRKREGAEQLQQKGCVVGLQEVPHPEWIDISGPHHGSPLPPGWEQCLDLQSGEMYIVNSATQTRAAGDSRRNLVEEWAAGQGKNGNSHLGMTVGSDSKMKPPSAIGVGLPFGERLPKDLALQQQGGVCLNSSLNQTEVMTNSDMSMMVAMVCLHCHTFVMVSRHCSYCPNCKNFCNVTPVPTTPRNVQA